MKSFFVFIFIAILSTACSDDYYLDLEESESFDPRSGEKGALTLYEISGDLITKLGDYNVPRKYEVYQEDSRRHKDIWEKVVNTIPQRFRSKIVEYEVFVGSGSLDGYVHPVDDEDLSKWRLALAVDIDEYESESTLEEYMTYLILHEFGHVVTLNNDQLNAAKDFSTCQEYALDEGCSLEQSHINKVFDIGWEDIMDKVNFEDEERTYRLYPMRFLSEYAATNVAEDAAEVFARFILDKNKPIGKTIAEMKIRAFYESKELTQMRKEIRAALEPELMLLLSNNSKSFHLRGHRACKHKHAIYQ